MSNLEVSFVYVHVVLLALLLLLCELLSLLFLILLRRHRVRLHNRVPGPDRP